LSPARCPSFEKHFWRQLCEKIGFDLDTVKAHVDNNKERKRREQATKRITETSSAFQEALSKGDVDTAKRLQETITREFTQLSKSEEIIRVATIPVSKDMIKDELMRLGDGIKTGLFIGETEVLLTRGGLSTVGGATAHGKTTVMCNLALNIIKHDNTSVLYITIEEPTSAITTRLINIHCNLRLAENNIRTVKHWLRTGSEDMFTGKKAPAQFLERGEKFWDLIRSGQLNVVRGTKSLEEVIALIHAAVEHNPNMGCVVIDYLQLLYPDTPSSARHEEIKRICDSLLQTSISLGIAILSACQFNRDVKGYKDVVSTSLAEGGSIERYCDQVIGVWNHTFDTPPKDRLGIKILKERNGVIRHGELRWDGNLGLVENVVKA